MKYAFVLGRHPALSVAELRRASPDLTIESVIDGICIGACAALPTAFINKIGGTIKIAALDTEKKSLRDVTANVMRGLIPAREGRIIFGISIYGHVPGV